MNDLPRRTEPAAVDLMVLNYNGRGLLAECLPSVVRAAAGSRHACRVRVIDNDSTDDSVAFLGRAFPGVVVVSRTNRGLCSFNEAVASSNAPVAILLNNDIKLDERCVDPLVAPLLEAGPAADNHCFMTAPLCWLFDEVTYEGMKTAVRWRWGLVQATALFEGHQRTIHKQGYTASAGAVLAVDRKKYLELGGFDPLYLPGRLEDLDLCFRGYRAGYHARYVPDAVAYHQGCGTFGESYGRAGCDRLALRNTLLFQWKNLRHPLHVMRQFTGLPVRLLRDLMWAPWAEPGARFLFVQALRDALLRWRETSAATGALTGGTANSLLKKSGATAGLSSSASIVAENTAGQASSGTHFSEERLFQHAAKAVADAKDLGERRVANGTPRLRDHAAREREFFRRFHPHAMIS